MNPSTPEDVLRELSTSISTYIRLAVAENTNSSAKTLVNMFEYEKSLEYPSDEVIGALYNNSKVPYVAKKIIETLFGEML